jgi:hypothetical protein
MDNWGLLRQKQTNKQTNGSTVPITQVPHNKGLYERAKFPSSQRRSLVSLPTGPSDRNGLR